MWRIQKKSCHNFSLWLLGTIKTLQIKSCTLITYKPRWWGISFYITCVQIFNSCGNYHYNHVIKQTQWTKNNNIRKFTMVVISKYYQCFCQMWYGKKKCNVLQKLSIGKVQLCVPQTCNNKLFLVASLFSIWWWNYIFCFCGLKKG